MSATATIRDEAEIVVVGAGPCGTAAAATLAELGHDVLMLDKDEFPREKPCGDALMHPAVAAAQRIGLEELMEASLAIDGARVILGHRTHNLTPLAAAPGRPLPRCIPRSEFDAAMLDAAQARGARFRRARVVGFEDDGGRHQVVATAEEESFAVAAGTVVAADGATSRLRRVTSPVTARPAAYAVRQYFRSEKPLEPIFDSYLPLEVDGQVLSGYGWVFPLDEHVANVGVGFYRDRRHRTPPLTRALEVFVLELQSKAGHRFGQLEPIGEPMGSPVGVRSNVPLPEAAGLLFSGDAAGTTHAVTGEGIAFAIRSGEEVARALHAEANRNGSSLPGSGEGVLQRPFPQLGIDVSMLTRVWGLEMNRGTTGSVGSAPKPFLSVVKRILGESAYETRIDATPAWDVMATCGPAFAQSLEEVNGALLDSLANRLPFVTEVIHRSSRAHLGPIYAAVALAVAAGDSETVPEGAIAAGVAAETVGVLPELLTMLVNRAPSKSLRVNNALAILTGDFAATRALVAAAKLGAPAVRVLGQACQRGCEGGMRDSTARFDSGRGVESWAQAAGETAGAAATLALQLGTIARGEDTAATEALHSYARELGIATRLAEEIVELTVDEGLHPGTAGASLRRGIYPLPVLYAAETEPRLPSLLAWHGAEDGDMSEVLDLVRECGALDRAVEECSRRCQAAAAIAAEHGGAAADLLEALAAAPAEYAGGAQLAELAGD